LSQNTSFHSTTVISSGVGGRTAYRHSSGLYYIILHGTSYVYLGSLPGIILVAWFQKRNGSLHS
jgi:hypothetical protein